MISGVLSLGGDLYDVTNSKKIYDSATGKFDPSVMPYEKGDLVSDWASSSYSSGYYEPVDAGNVKEGVSFGRGESGSLTSPTLSGNAGTADVLSGKTFYSNSYTKQTGSYSLVYVTSCSLGAPHTAWVQALGGGNTPYCQIGTDCEGLAPTPRTQVNTYVGGSFKCYSNPNTGAAASCRICIHY